MPESRTAEEALRHNCCALTTANAQIIARAAAGLLHEHRQEQLARDHYENEIPDEDWHHGMLSFLNQQTSSMVTTAYEKRQE